MTMGIPSDGSYGIPEGLIFGFPVTTENGEYTLVRDLPIDEFSQKAIDKTLAELEEERVRCPPAVSRCGRRGSCACDSRAPGTWPGCAMRVLTVSINPVEPIDQYVGCAASH